MYIYIYIFDTPSAIIYGVYSIAEYLIFGLFRVKTPESTSFVRAMFEKNDHISILGIVINPCSCFFTGIYIIGMG